jgi:predicted dehydrogenase
MIKLAVMGAAHIHMPGYVQALKERTDVVVTAIWDHDITRAQKYANEMNSCVVVNMIEALQSADSILVCAETDRHLAIVAEAAKLKKHIYLEKPIGLNGSDAREMVKMIESSGVHFQTGFGKRSYGYTRFLREQIAKGVFGKISRVRISCVHGGALRPKFDTEYRWMADPVRSGGGGFFDMGAHGLDLLIWWLGEVESATAAIGSALNRYPNCDEFGEGVLRFKNGVVATLAAGWIDTTDPHDIQIWGTEGHAFITRDDKFYFRSDHVAGADGKLPWTKFPANQQSPFLDFLDTLAGKAEKELITAREAAYVASVMEAMYVGFREEKWVHPKKVNS